MNQTERNKTLPQNQSKPPLYMIGTVRTILTVIAHDGRYPGTDDDHMGEHRYITKCECGDHRTVRQAYLRNDKIYHCCKNCALENQKSRNKKVKASETTAMMRYAITTSHRSNASHTLPGEDPAPFDRIHRRRTA